MNVFKPLRLLVTLAALIVASPAYADVIVQDSDENKRGSTTSKGSYVVEDVGENVKITVDFSVKKTGVSGTGKGVMVFAILDDNWEPAFQIEKGFSVGAHAIKGVAKKKFSESVTATGPKAKRIKEEGIYAAFTVQTDRDTIGLLTSVGAWKKEIQDWTEIAGVMRALPTGEVKIAGGWRIKKIK
jgi:hypothetical protein